MTGDWGLVKCNNASKLGLLSHDPPGGGRFLNMEIKLCILSCCSKYKDKISLTTNCMWGNLLNVLWEPNRSFCTGLFYPQSISCVFPCHFLVCSTPSSTFRFCFPNTTRALFAVKIRGNGVGSSPSSYTFNSAITVCPTQSCDAPEAPVSATRS